MLAVARLIHSYRLKFARKLGKSADVPAFLRSPLGLTSHVGCHCLLADTAGPRPFVAVLALFSGEEQGLLSSSHYAPLLRQRREDVALMLQVDMVGYRKPGEPMQLARPDKIGLLEAGWLVGNLSEVYVPELVVGCVLRGRRRLSRLPKG